MTLTSKRTIVTVCAALALSGCGPMLAMMSAGSPSSVSSKTSVDEQAALSVELAYQVSAQLILTAAKAGLLDDATVKARVRDADNRAYKAVLAARAAYRASNAVEYGSAAAESRAAISEIVSLLK